MTTRKYSSRSQQTTLTGTVNPGDSTINVVSGSALLGGVTLSAGETFTIVINPDTALEEIVDIYSAVGNPVSGNILTVQRNIDGSTAQSHSAGAVVRHMAIGRDFREANTHIESSTSVHGITGSVVGTTDTQTLTNKTLTSPALNTPTIDGLSVQEKVEDIVGAMVSSNTESGIAVTYDDATGKLNFDVSDPTITLSGDVTGSATITNLGNATITTTISAGTIVNADINAAAAIDKTKISGTAITAADTGTVTSTMIADGTIVNADINSAAAIDKTKISGTAVTLSDVGTVTGTMIASDTITNADINSSAQIAYSKLNQTNSIVDADINASAAIAWTKIAPSSTVSATELGYLDGVTSAVQTQLNSKLATSTAASTYAPLASPALTGVPTAPTATAGTNTTQVATTAFVKTAVDNVIAAAPGALDTLDELAAALGDDANFATTVTNNLATKLPLTGGTMSGAIAMGTNKITGMGNPTLAQDAATKYYVDNVTIAPSNLTGPITSVGNITSVASQTGTGSTFVMNTSPTLVTPVLGVATATSINGTTIPTSKTLVATDSTAYVVPSQTGNAGKFLTTNGTNSSWSTTVLGTFVSNSASGDADSARNISLQIDGTTYGRILVPTGSGGAMAFWTGSTPAERMRISSTGAITTTGALGVAEGIGSDSAVFQIGNGRTADGNTYIDLIGDTTYTDYGLRIIRASGANGVSQIIHRGTNNFALTTTDAANMLLQTNAITRMVINSAGNVGIGTTSPAAGQIFAITKDLTGSTSPIGANVSGTIQSDATVGTRGFNTFISTAATAFTVPTIYHYRAAQGTFGAGSAVTNQYGFYAETTLTDAGTNIGFYGNIPAGSNRFNFYAGGTAGNYFAGRTGIGTFLTGTAMAAVFNTTAADIGFLIRGAASQTGDLLTVQDSAATNLARITSAGNVGIGTTPTARLHASTSSTTAYGLISQTPVVGLTAGNTVNMAYFADGRSAANDGLRIYNLRDTTGANNGDWQTSSFRIQRNVDGVAVQGEIAIGNGWLSLAGASGEVMRVTGASVGIGTTSPSTALHVSSGSGARVRAGGATGSGFEFNDANTRFDIPAANTIAAYTGNAERMRIDSAGNVGIGITNPLADLHIGSSTTVSDFRMGNSAAATVLSMYTTSNDMVIYNATAGGILQLGTNNTERIRIDGSGNTTINSVADATTTTAARGGGYMGIPASAASGSGAYTVVAADAGEHIYTTTTRTVTIPANASVAFPVGTVLSFISGAGATTTIAITTDTMYLAGTGTTGSRTLAAHGMATAVKVASTTWYISGNGLT